MQEDVGVTNNEIGLRRLPNKYHRSPGEEKQYDSLRGFLNYLLENSDQKAREKKLNHFWGEINLVSVESEEQE